MAEVLFGEPDPARPGTLSADQRRTIRQARLLEAGLHPLAIVLPKLALHPDAAPPGDRQAPGLRCGSCARLFHRTDVSHAGGYAKCELWPSRGAASDIRAWWPACRHHQAGEGA